MTCGQDDGGDEKGDENVFTDRIHCWVSRD